MANSEVPQPVNQMYETRFSRTEAAPDFSDPSSQQAEFIRGTDLARAQMEQSGLYPKLFQVAEPEKTQD